MASEPVHKKRKRSDVDDDEPCALWFFEYTGRPEIIDGLFFAPKSKVALASECNPYVPMLDSEGKLNKIRIRFNRFGVKMVTDDPGLVDTQRNIFKLINRLYVGVDLIELLDEWFELKEMYSTPGATMTEEQTAKLKEYNHKIKSEDAIWSYSWGTGRGYSAEGVFIENKKKVQRALRRNLEVYFGEICGKHSEVTVDMKDLDVTMISDDPHFIENFMEMASHGCIQDGNGNLLEMIDHDKMEPSENESSDDEKENGEDEDEEEDEEDEDKTIAEVDLTLLPDDDEDKTENGSLDKSMDEFPGTLAEDAM